MIIIVSTCIILALAAFECLYKRQIKKCARKIPGLPMLPFIGNAHQIPTTPTGFYKLLIKLSEFGLLTRLLIGPFLYLHVSDPTICEEILIKNPLMFKTDDYNLGNDWVGDGLGTSRGEKWKRRRKLLNSAFHYQNLKDYISVYTRAARILINKWNKLIGSSFDVYPTIDLCALDIIAEVTTGMQLNTQSNQNDEYVRAVQYLGDVFMARITSIFLRFDFIFMWTSRYKEYKKSLDVVHEISRRAVKERRQYLKDMNKFDTGNNHENVKKAIFLDTMMLGSEKEMLSDEDIREEIDTFLFAGHDTLASALSFIVYNLSQNSEAQNKVFREQFEIFGDDISREVTSNDLSRMKYTEMAIKESLRLHSTVPVVFRKVTEPILINGVQIPKGTNIAINMMIMHRSAELYDNPSAYIPERFDLEELSKRHPLSFIPFVAGHRNCIGQKFALLEMKTLISHLIREFVFLTDTSELQLGVDVVLRSVNGIKVKLARRPRLASA